MFKPTLTLQCSKADSIVVTSAVASAEVNAVDSVRALTGAVLVLVTFKDTRVDTFAETIVQYTVQAPGGNTGRVMAAMREALPIHSPVSIDLP